MKVLINAISTRKGGIVTYTRNLMAAFAERQVNSTFAVAPGFSNNANVLPVAASDMGPLRRVLWEQTVWRSIVKNHKPDVLFSSANFGLLKSPVPQVLLLREGGLFDPLYLANVAPCQGATPAILRASRRNLMLLSARGADHVITPTKAMRDLVLAWAPDLENRISVNPYGTLSQAFSPATQPRPWRGDGVLRLIYVSVYYPHKNPGVIVRGIEKLCRNNMPAHGIITMSLEEVAQTLGGAYDRHILEQARNSGYIELGRRDYAALPDLYRSQDVFVFPSVSETFGHPMAEALSVGLPVVAADTPVNREICGDAALYFDPFSSDDFCQRIKELNERPALREQMAMAGRQRALDLFTWERHVENLIEILQNVAAHRSHKQ